MQERLDRPLPTWATELIATPSLLQVQPKVMLHVGPAATAESFERRRFGTVIFEHPRLF